MLLLLQLLLIRSQCNPTKFNRLKESSQRALRYHNHGRTNQFEVTSQLEGLVEKFSVLDREPLSLALQERLDVLSKLDIKWEPEILHLLLELSDRPVVNSKLEDLEFLKEPEPNVGPPLKWKELVAEDPLLREKHIWRNVDFGADSAEEDEFEDSRSEVSETTTVVSSINEDFYHRPGRYAVEAPNKDDLRELRKAQFWLKAPSVGGVKLETVKKPITELQAIRESLFMLSGLPTSLFESSSSILKVIEPSKGYALKTSSHDAFYKILRSLADHGTALQVLRTWTRKVQTIPLLQIFQNSVLKRMDALNNLLSAMELRYVAADGDVVVSLLSTRIEVDTLVRPFVRISFIIQKLDAEPYAHSFRYLEMLYDETCISQMAGDDIMYAFTGHIFFECFQLYLSPLRKWMEEGELDPDDKVFFVSESMTKTEAASIWQSRYKLRRSQARALHAPSFLCAVANKIFTTGKSVVVLKHLNRFSLLQSAVRDPEPVLNFSRVCSAEKFLAPFSELFNTAFEEWVQSKHHHASVLLRKILFDSCGLRSALESLSSVYFMADGATSAFFTNSVFDKLDTLNEAWNDRFTLTELSQETFGSLQPITPDRLRVRILSLPRKYQEVAKCRRSVKALSVIEMLYQLTWPIQIIVMPNTVSSYQRIFTFLFQIRRSTHILSRQRLVKDTLSHTSNSDERALYYSLRTRLLWFNQTLYHYLTEVVLNSRSRKVSEELKAATDVDSMIQAHSTFIKMAIDQALLGTRLELIQKTILKILDIGIKLEDAQAANAVASKEAMEEQQEMMDRSMASLGLHTPQRNGRISRVSKGISSKKLEPDSSSDDEEKELDVDMSILSSNFDGGGAELAFVDQLRKLRGDFDRLVRFVASGLKGVARAGGGEEAKSWDLLGEMLEAGIGTAVSRY